MAWGKGMREKNDTGAQGVRDDGLGGGCGLWECT